MKPYYQEKGITIYHGDCREILPGLEHVDLVVTDPPFNVGYHYKSYKDKLSSEEYAALLVDAIRMPAVVVHYPEDMFFVSSCLRQQPRKCVAWVYNALTPRKWRMFAWFGIEPDFSLLKQPYKNPDDKRIMKEKEKGKEGANLYDWWHNEQTKNVSKEKTEHPCQMPLVVMKKSLAITKGEVVADPFMGSGTTLRAAKDLGREAIGIEIEEKYCEIAAKRLAQGVLF